MNPLLSAWPVRKLLTRPIYYYESRRSYPVTQKIHALPPLPVLPASQAQTVLGVMTGPRDIDNTLALWAAYTLLKQTATPVGLVFLLERAISPEQEQTLTARFPGVSFVNADTLIESEKHLPRCAAFARQSIVGKKLLLVLWAQERYNLLYSDADMLCFGPMHELQLDLQQAECNWYMKETHDKPSYEPTMLARIKAEGLECTPFLNAGFGFIRRGSYDPKLAEHLLNSDSIDLTSWWTEQTMTAAFMHLAGAKPLPVERYVVNTARQWFFQPDVNYNEISVRHFISPVRHLMYLKGIPKAYAVLQKNGKQSQTLDS